MVASKPRSHQPSFTFIDSLIHSLTYCGEREALNISLLSHKYRTNSRSLSEEVQRVVK